MLDVSEVELELTRDEHFAGMKIATYANARTALEARKGIAPAFMCGKIFKHSTDRLIFSTADAHGFFQSSSRIKCAL